MLMKPVAIDLKKTNLMQLLVLQDLNKTYEKNPIIYTKADIEMLMCGTRQLKSCREEIREHVEPITDQFASLAQLIQDYSISLTQMQMLLNYIRSNVEAGNITCKTEGI